MDADGAKQRAWGTRLGFKSKHGTADAIVLVRLLLERTWAEQSGRPVLLALDWAKAFDSVSPESLCLSLEGFGVPTHFIYTYRTCSLRDAGKTSEEYPQAFGISQGCPLSPFYSHS